MGYIYIIQSLKESEHFKIGITFILPELLVFKLNNYSINNDYTLLFEGTIPEKINSLTLETVIHDYLKEMNLWIKEDLFKIKKEKLNEIILSIENIIIT